jgi:hypothetical protein
VFRLLARRAVRGVGAVVPRPMRSSAPYGLASGAPTPHTVLRTFSRDPLGPTSHMIPRASGLKHMIEPSSVRFSLVCSPSPLQAVPMQLCVHYLDSIGSTYFCVSNNRGIGTYTSIGTYTFIGTYTLKGTFWAIGTFIFAGTYTLKGAFTL